MPRHYTRRPLADRLWEKVLRGASDECWLWLAARTRNGYGKIGIPERGVVLAHRVAWELTHGPVPPGMFVCHSCDVRTCVNPRHLWLGTCAQNLADMRAKGRGNPWPNERARGSRHSHAKLTAEDVMAIRAAYSAGETQHAIAPRFGVSVQQVSRIVRRELWKHLP
ncbi:MAG TPA: HNH endonuclease [Kofleriaceae bacterium]|nr:HNH endonuclease [Kofleriaceae bacterium]